MNNVIKGQFKKIYICSICGKKGEWGKSWAYYYEIYNAFCADGYEIPIITCLGECRKKYEPIRQRRIKEMDKKIKERFNNNHHKKGFESLNIISVDPSTNTGIFVYTPKFQKSFTVQFKEKDRIKRLGSVLRYFSKLVQSTKWDLLIIEGYSYGAQNSRSITSQAEIGGIIRGLFSAFNISVLEIPIPTWKTTTGIKMKKNRKSEKENYIFHFNTYSEFFKQQINKKNIVFNPHNPDEVDAILFFYTAVVLSRGQVLLKDSLKISEDIRNLNL